jgi:type II secretory pathway pseudopilin PulG
MTLIELMMVVIILTVLSVVAVGAYQRYIFQGRDAEAVQMLGAVRVAQETYFQTFGQYCGSTSPSIWPASMPFDTPLDWGTPPEGNAWRDLGLHITSQVWFQYQLAAGTSGGDASMFTDNSKPWFYARAHGDFNNDGTQSTFEITSQSSEIFQNAINN